MASRGTFAGASTNDFVLADVSNTAPGFSTPQVSAAKRKDRRTSSSASASMSTKQQQQQQQQQAHREDLWGSDVFQQQNKPGDENICEDKFIVNAASGVSFDIALGNEQKIHNTNNVQDPAEDAQINVRTPGKPLREFISQAEDGSTENHVDTVAEPKTPPMPSRPKLPILSSSSSNILDDSSRLTGSTLQRFSTRIEGRVYHVRIFEKLDGQLSASFFDQELGQYVRVKRLQSQWLANSDASMRQELCQTSFFRDNAASILRGNKKPSTSSAPRRAPPPVPAGMTSPKVEASTSAESFGSGPFTPALPRKSIHNLESDASQIAADVSTEKIPAQTNSPLSSPPQKRSAPSSPALSPKAMEIVQENPEPTIATECSAAATAQAAPVSKVSTSDSGTQTVSFMNSSPEMAQLKMDLMDQREISERLERERDDWREKHDRLNEELSIIEQELPQTLEARQREVEDLTRELTNVSHQLNVYKNQSEQYSQSEQEARERAEMVERELEEERSRSERMNEEMQAMRRKMTEMEEQHREVVNNLSSSLEEMTESYNAHKEYGATLKTKIMEVHEQAETRVQGLANEKAKLEEMVSQEQKLVRQGEQKLQELMAELQDTKEEGSNAQREFVALGHECAELRKQCKELEDEVDAVREFAAAHQNEADHARGEVEAQRAVYEEQRQTLIRSHRNELKELKVKLFDATDAVEAKKKEVEELTGYVNEILAQQESYDSVICEACKVKVSRAMQEL